MSRADVLKGKLVVAPGTLRLRESVQDGGVLEAGIRHGHFPACKRASSFLRTCECIVLVFSPLNLLCGSRPGGMDLAHEIARLRRGAEIDQPKLDQIMVLSRGMRCA